MPHRYPIRHALREARHAHVIATPECEVRWAHPAARWWLKQFFSRPERAKNLPRKICRWLAAEAQSAGRHVLVVRRDDAYLFVHWQRPHARDAIVLLLELAKAQPARTRRAVGSLTAREGAVLRWLAAGKSNREIGEILDIAPSTVGKHLEHIYEKLGVENRTAAASYYVMQR